MSMNIYFKALREVVVKKTGKSAIEVVRHDVWQTPTKVTYEIYESKDPVQAYVDWVLSKDVDDPFCQDHADEFLSWAAMMEAEGYDIKPAVC